MSTLFAQQSVNNRSLTPGLIAQWKALPGLTGGNRWYSSTSRYHATITTTGAAGTFPTWVGPTRKDGFRELKFNNAADYVSAPDVKELNSTATFTLTVWLKQPVLDVWGGIFEKSASASAYIDIITYIDGNLMIELSNAGVYTNGIFDYSTRVTANKWFHLAVVYNGAGTGNAGRLKLYIDGIPATLTYTSTIPATLDNLSGASTKIGMNGTNKPWTGSMDDFRLYNHPLAQAEILTIMQGDPLFVEPSVILPTAAPVVSKASFFRFFQK